LMLGSVLVTPAFASKPEDLALRWKVINRVARHHPLTDLGFAVYLHSARSVFWGDLKKNLEPYLNVPITVHAPVDADRPEKCDLTTVDGWTSLMRVCDFAHDIGAKVVDVHPSVAHPKKLSSTDDTHKIQEEWLEQVTRNVHHVQDRTDIAVAVENEPLLLQRPGRLVFDGADASLSQLSFLAQRGIKLCFDTAHYVITASTVKWLSTRDAKDDNHLAYAGFRWYNPKDFEAMPPLNEVLSKLAPSIIDVHFNDAKANGFVGGLPAFTEAVPPEGGGMVRYADLSSIVEAKKHDSSLFVINAEISETNHFKPVNAESCLNQLCEKFKI